MKFRTWAEIERDIWWASILTGFTAGLAGLVADTICGSVPLFVIFGVSAGVAWVRMLGSACQAREQYWRAEYEREQAAKRDAYPWERDGETPRGYQELPRQEYGTVVTVDGPTTRISNLARCYEVHHRSDPNRHINGLVAAENFIKHIEAGRQISSRKCEPMCGGRESYVAMRDECVRVGVIVKVGSGYAPALPDARAPETRARTHTHGVLAR